MHLPQRRGFGDRRPRRRGCLVAIDEAVQGRAAPRVIGVDLHLVIDRIARQAPSARNRVILAALDLGEPCRIDLTLAAHGIEQVLVYQFEQYPVDDPHCAQVDKGGGEHGRIADNFIGKAQRDCVRQGGAGRILDPHAARGAGDEVDASDLVLEATLTERRAIDPGRHRAGHRLAEIGAADRDRALACLGPLDQPRQPAAAPDIGEMARIEPAVAMQIARWHRMERIELARGQLQIGIADQRRPAPRRSQHPGARLAGQRSDDMRLHHRGRARKGLGTGRAGVAPAPVGSLLGHRELAVFVIVLPRDIGRGIDVAHRLALPPDATRKEPVLPARIKGAVRKTCVFSMGFAKFVGARSAADG